MAGSVYGSVYVLKPVNRSAGSGVVRTHVKRGHKALTVNFLETRGAETRREVIRSERKVPKGEVRTWRLNKMTIKRNQKAKRNGRGKVCQQHVAIDTEKIREKLGTCLTQPDRVEYRHVGCLSRGKRQTNTYELRARCNGHWLSVQELIAVDELEGAEWERYSGVLRRDLCQIGMLRLMKHYGLDVPLGVRLAAEKAEAIS